MVRLTTHGKIYEQLHNCAKFATQKTYVFTQNSLIYNFCDSSQWWKRYNSV